MDRGVELYYRAHTMKKKVHSRLHRLLWNGEILEKKRKCGKILQIQKVCEFQYLLCHFSTFT